MKQKGFFKPTILKIILFLVITWGVFISLNHLCVLKTSGTCLIEPWLCKKTCDWDYMVWIYLGVLIPIYLLSCVIISYINELRRKIKKKKD